ncbi:unnamed protein product [Microthlaspi erraticum]|uniref:Uncharacterized protein n=1 Tax=Microthlaspi erraticum TaxID=1685480 RepID=A0A6D2JS33_9BRAS|nr:unnamed protein product [Microthlaspi erraticum]
MKWYIQGLVFGYLSAPQRTGRLGRGLEMGDGHQEHSTQLGSAHSIELVAPLPLFFIFKVCVASLALVELCSLEAVVGSPEVNSTLSSIELSFLCLDSIESGGRAGASGLGTLPPSLRVVSPSLGSKERLCEALGQGASLEW